MALQPLTSAASSTYIHCNSFVSLIFTEQFMEFDENNSGDIGEYVL